MYWQQDVTLIDFPQMVDATVNPNAETFLQRDIQRVVDYFAPLGVSADADGIASGLWRDFLNGRL